MFHRHDTEWSFGLGKENNSIHILVRQVANTVTPEDSGLPVATLYGPNAIIKHREQSLDSSKMAQTLDTCASSLYQGRLRITEQLSTSEWAMIGSLGNDTNNDRQTSDDPGL
jgi:hypothetical protein